MAYKTSFLSYNLRCARTHLSIIDLTHNVVRISKNILVLFSGPALAGRLRAGTELPINLQNFGLDTPLKASLNQCKGVNVVKLGGELENGHRLAYALQSRLPR